MKLNQFILYLSIGIISNQVESGVVLEITLQRYDNPTNQASDGLYCKILPKIACKHTFQVDVYSTNGIGNVIGNPIFSGATGIYSYMSTVIFSANAYNLGLYNPIKIPITSWLGGFSMKVSIRDSELFNQFEEVDNIIYTSADKPPASSNQTSLYTSSVVYGSRSRAAPTKLTFTSRHYCDKNYYGTDCSKFCQDSNDVIGGHYTCEKTSGNKICLPGWQSPGSSCLIKQPSCSNNTCTNGATCIDGAQTSYTCLCQPGFEGRSCENDIDECLATPCQNNGQCSNAIGDFGCLCSGGYVGKTCNLPACQQNNPCKNGGTCFGKQQCMCSETFVGETCSVLFCRAVECKNRGVCLMDGSCSCKRGTRGIACEVNECDLINCQNGGMCFEGVCQCLNGFAGKFCQINQLCSKYNCRNGGSCLLISSSQPTESLFHGSIYATPQCVCPINYIGDFCQFPLTTIFIPNYGGGNSQTASCNSGHLMIGVITLSVIALVLFLVLLSIGVALCIRRQKNKRDDRYKKQQLLSVSSVNSEVTEFGSVSEIITGSEKNRIILSEARTTGSNRMNDNVYTDGRLSRGNKGAREDEILSFSAAAEQNSSPPSYFKVSQQNNRISPSPNFFDEAAPVKVPVKQVTQAPQRSEDTKITPFSEAVQKESETKVPTDKSSSDTTNTTTTITTTTTRQIKNGSGDMNGNYNSVYSKEVAIPLPVFVDISENGYDLIESSLPEHEYASIVANSEYGAA